MITAVCALAALSIVPQPSKLVEGQGVCRNGEVRYTKDASIPAEGYRLSVKPDGIDVASADEAGRFYADITLRQLRKPGKDAEYPCVEIEDAPRYPWRGIHFDDSRHFFGKEAVKKTLDMMALHKFNVFHWHLTDDQGWRFDVPGYPELVKYGSVRSASPLHGAHPHVDSGKQTASQLDGQIYGPFFYTEADLKEIVAYAAARHVKVVPEIELPGHFQAVLAAYPEFACVPGNIKDRDPLTVWGISKDVMCLGNDKAVKFMEDVLDYVCRVFPGDVVHIGGDECPQVRWRSCVKCQERIKAEGLGNEKGLQPWITRHFVKFLADRGKRVIGWDEYLLGDIPSSAMGMSWRMSSSGGAGHERVGPAAAVAKGHDVVMTPTAFCYLDYGQGLKEDPFDYIGGSLPLSRVYEFDPCAGIPAEHRKHILGGQGNNWSEYTWNIYDLEWKMWPRACAIAEVLWTGESRPGFDDFARRMVDHRRRLIVEHRVNCAPLK